MTALAETLRKLQEHLQDGSSWGYFGGAFDPPHQGHLELAKALCRAEKLDGVILAPSFHPPHKSAPEASFEDRMAMCELVCSAEPRFVVCDIESQLPTPGFTVEIIPELQRQFPQVAFSVLVGADNLRILASWSRIESLLGMATMIVGSRPGVDAGALSGADGAIPEELLDRVRVVQSPLVDISSSTLRSELRARAQAPAAIHPDVYRYIREHRLYQ
jgi:nicotinate-nucleotide adenylyltransferase